MMTREQEAAFEAQAFTVLTKALGFIEALIDGKAAIVVEHKEHPDAAPVKRTITLRT